MSLLHFWHEDVTESLRFDRYVDFVDNEGGSDVREVDARPARPGRPRAGRSLGAVRRDLRLLQLFVLRLLVQLQMKPVFNVVTRDFLDLRASVVESSAAPFELLEEGCCSCCCCSGWCC
jgi:hypothetical protein